MAHDLSLDEALAAIREWVAPLGIESVALDRCVGRRLAMALESDVDSPPHDKSLMDGYALRADDLQRGLRRFRIVETVTAGELPRQVIAPGTAARIMTGAPIPVGSDVVVMRERQMGGGREGEFEWVELDTEPLPIGHHILRRSSCMRRGEVIFPKGHLFRSFEVGVLAEMGLARLPVFSRPSIAILATGNELIPHDCPGETGASRDSHTPFILRGAVPKPGCLRNSNGPLLRALAAAFAEQVVDLGIARDDLADLTHKCRQGVQHRVLVLSGGVSEGVLDLVPKVLQELGVVQVFHKVAMKPGKPIWFGVRDRGQNATYVFGLPGNPLSTLVGYRVFVRACLDQLSGGIAGWPTMERVELGRAHPVRGSRPTFWPVRKIRTDRANRVVEPLAWDGSSDQRCLVEADGLAFLPPREDAYPAGSSIDYLSLYDMG